MEAILVGLKLAVENGLKDVVVSSDSLQVVQIIKGEQTPPPWYTMSILRDCSEL